jgi:hypothetical protein
MTPDELPADMEARTPAPEGEAWRHVSQEEMAQAAKFASNNLASPVVPAPEGVFVSETCEGEVCWCGKPAVRKVGEEFAYDEPNPNRHNLTRYICAHHFAELMGPAGARSVGIAPVVPVGVSETDVLSVLTAERDELKAALEWADRMAKSSLDALSATLNQPVVPVGMSREEIARAVHRGRFPEDRKPTPFEAEDASGTTYCFRIADAIIAALRPTDTGRE